MSALLYVAPILSSFVIVVAFPQSNIPTEVKETDDLTSQKPDDYWEHRSFLKYQNDLWPAKPGPNVYIPYEINKLEPEVEKILHFYIDLFNNKSCIHWYPRSTEADFVAFEPALDDWGNIEDTCYTDAIGRKGGRQFIRITSLCLGLGPGDTREHWKGMPHEMMHALGFCHEQERRDSRCYLNFSKEGEKDDQSGIYKEKMTEIHFPYDFQSIMHYYDPRLFVSRQGELVGSFGLEPSWQDWWKINYLYCGAQHICEVHKDMCDKHNKRLIQCYNEGRLDYHSSDKHIFNNY
uniref:Metalloendopeptidase n=1 Tax=Graphocephala atropunctata TaxID=36148 RepID=A0A1B6KW48_9HEMI